MSARNWTAEKSRQKVWREGREEQAAIYVPRGTRDPDRVFERGGTAEELAEGLRLLGREE